MTSGREKAVLDRLQRRLRALQRQQRQLQCEQSRVRFHHALLGSLYRNLFVKPGTPSTGIEEDLAQAAAVAAAAAEEEFELEQGRIAPRDDPLALFNLLLESQDQDPTGQTSATAAGLAQLLREAVLQGSLHLERKKRGLIDAAEFEEQVSRQWFRFLHPMLTAIVTGKAHVLSEVSTYDLAALQPDPQAGVLGTAKTTAAVPKLNLSPLQLEDMAVGNTLFASLCGNIQQQYQQLQAAAASTAPVGGSSAVTGAQAREQCSPQDFLKGYMQQLQQRTHATERFAVLVNKELTVRAAAGAFVMGCLTWEQLASGWALSWPFPLRLAVVMDEVAQHQG